MPPHGLPLDRWLALVAELMLALAQLRPGERILDVAAGEGETALRATDRVGPTGFVLALDRSAASLAVAEQTARACGLAPTRFATRVQSGTPLPLADASFDVALWCLGRLPLPDPREALAELHRVLRPGGRVVIESVTSPQLHPLVARALPALGRYPSVLLADQSLSGPFALASPEALQDAYEQAGFRAGEPHVMAARLALPSAAAWVHFERESCSILHQLVAGLPETQQEAAWRDIEQAVRSLEGWGGFEVPAELLIGVGIKR